MKKAILTLIVLIMMPCAMAELMISEIMYNPEGSDTDKEWIELYTNEEINFSGYRLRENGVNHNIQLYQGSFDIEPNSFMIIARDPETFLTKYPTYSGNLASSIFSLKNTGEEIIIVNSSLYQIDDVFYQNLAAEGKSIELKDPNLDNSNMDNWIEGPGDPGNILNSSIPEFNTMSYAIITLLSGLIMIKIRK